MFEQDRTIIRVVERGQVTDTRDDFVTQLGLAGRAAFVQVERRNVSHTPEVTEQLRKLNIAREDGTVTCGDGEFRDRFGVELLEGYGLTETSPVVTSHIGIPVRPGSVGKPAPGVQLRVVDDLGNEVPYDDSGEIQVRGPGVFMGYWDDEEATGE